MSQLRSSKMQTLPSVQHHVASTVSYRQDVAVSRRRLRPQVLATQGLSSDGGVCIDRQHRTDLPSSTVCLSARSRTVASAGRRRGVFVPVDGKVNKISGWGGGGDAKAWLRTLIPIGHGLVLHFPEISFFSAPFVSIDSVSGSNEVVRVQSRRVSCEIVESWVRVCLKRSCCA
jgi:hypothetical protein